MDPNSAADNARAWDISVDLSWIDLLKGIAIIGVIFDNWTGYMEFATDPALLHSAASAFAFAVGPFVQVFFILSGFGLTLSYLRQRSDWSWPRWAWRRITKIVLPYWIFVLFSFALGVLGSMLYASVDESFSWKCLVVLLTFTQNFLTACQTWNPPYWFMPVIIGLYISFPLLILILNRWGKWALLLIAAAVTYGTLAVAVWAGVHRGHATDLFTFWILQFALGMILAHVRETAPEKMQYLLGAKAFILGMGLIALSLVVRTYVPLGRLFNDSITSIGIFLVLLNVVWLGRAKIPAIGATLSALGRQSYLIYLIHYPIMKFLIGPLLRVPTNPIIVLALGAVFVLLVYFLSRLISRPLGKFTSWAYNAVSL